MMTASDLPVMKAKLSLSAWKQCKSSFYKDTLKFHPKDTFIKLNLTLSEFKIQNSVTGYG